MNELECIRAFVKVDDVAGLCSLEVVSAPVVVLDVSEGVDHELLGGRRQQGEWLDGAVDVTEPLPDGLT